MNDGALFYPPFDHWLWYIPAIFIGACIGSFLNVVIYRVPLGLSVNEPKRSFCPHCKKPIPLGRNIPLVSWLMLRGKCADCGAPIAFRYFAVELLTALMFAAVWFVFPPIVVLPLIRGPAMAAGSAATGFLVTFLLWGLLVGILFPHIHRPLHAELDSRRHTSLGPDAARLRRRLLRRPM